MISDRPATLARWRHAGKVTADARSMGSRVPRRPPTAGVADVAVPEGAGPAGAEHLDQFPGPGSLGRPAGIEGFAVGHPARVQRPADGLAAHDDRAPLRAGLPRRLLRA